MTLIGQSRSGGNGAATSCRQPRVAGDVAKTLRCGASAATADAGDSAAGQAQPCCWRPASLRSRGPRQDGVPSKSCSAAESRPASDTPDDVFHLLVSDALPADANGGWWFGVAHNSGQRLSTRPLRSAEPSPSSAAALAAKYLRGVGVCGGRPGADRARPETIDDGARRLWSPTDADASATPPWWTEPAASIPAVAVRPRVRFCGIRRPGSYLFRHQGVVGGRLPGNSCG